MGTTQSDLVKCRCNNCDGHLEFERSSAGERVGCPHCGMETLLFIPQETRTAVPNPPRAVKVQGEDSFLDEGGITVTKTRFMVGTQTYAVANITSVDALHVPASRVSAQLCLFIGVVTIGLSVWQLITAGNGQARINSLAVMLVGAILAGVAALVLKGTHDSYIVVLNTAGSELKTCSSYDKDLILRVVAALNNAIVARG
jgi:hypothetical protein